MAGKPLSDLYCNFGDLRPGDKVRRVDDPHGLAPCLHWTVDEVGDWLESVGFEKYKGHFRSHFINGKRLIDINSKFLPKIGIRKFDDIMALTHLIRDQLYIKPECRDWNKYAVRKGYTRTPHLTGNENKAVNYRRLVLDSERILTSRERCLNKLSYYYSGWSMVPGWNKVAKDTSSPHARGKGRKMAQDHPLNTTDYNLAPLLRKAALNNLSKELLHKENSKLHSLVSSASLKDTSNKSKTFIKAKDGRLLGVINWTTGNVRLVGDYRHTNSANEHLLAYSKKHSMSQPTEVSKDTQDDDKVHPCVYHGGVYLPVVFHWEKMQESRGYPKLQIRPKNPCLEED